MWIICRVFSNQVTFYIIQTTDQLESFMKTISSAFQLFDTRLVNITTKLNELGKCQEEMEDSMNHLHESVRNISATRAQPPPPPPPPPPPSQPQPAEYHQHVNTPVFFGPDEQPWWCSHSILNYDTFASPLSVVHPSQRLAARYSFNYQPPPQITQ